MCNETTTPTPTVMSSQMMTHTESPFWTNCSLFTPEQQAFANVFKGYEMEPDLVGHKLITSIREDFSLHQFASPELLSNYEIFKRVRRFLGQRQVDIPSRSNGSNALFLRMVDAFWPEEQFQAARERAFAMYQEARKRPRDIPAETPAPRLRISLPPAPVNDPGPPGFPPMPDAPFHSNEPSPCSLPTWVDEPETHPAAPTRMREETCKTGHLDLISKLQSRFRSDKQKFGGTPDENWSIALARYQRTSTEFGLSRTQKVQYIYHMFKDDAEQFYFDELQQVQSWDEVVRILNDRYNGAARKRAIVDELRATTITDYAADGEHDGRALQKLARRIEKLVPQCPPGRNGDTDKRDALYYAVRMCDWASGPITALSSSNKTYKQFLDELATAEQNHRIARGLQGLDLRQGSSYRRGGGGKMSEFTGGSASVWFAGQARYGRDPSARKTSRLSQRHDRQCHNCGSRDHFVDKCKEPRDDMRIMKNRIAEMTRGKTSEFIVKVLRKLLLEQAAHINYLSDHLLQALGQESDFTLSDEEFDASSDDLSAPAAGRDPRTSPYLETHAAGLAQPHAPTKSPSLTNALDEGSDQDFL